MSDARIDLIKLAIASAIRDRLEGRFDVELARWEKEAGVEQMGTGAIEAHFLANIAIDAIKEVSDAEIAERVAEYVQ